MVEQVMNENEFELDGKAYAAIEKAKSMDRCSYCAFRHGVECLEEAAIPGCSREVRLDGRSVIFMEKKQ